MEKPNFFYANLMPASYNNSQQRSRENQACLDSRPLDKPSFQSAGNTALNKVGLSQEVVASNDDVTGTIVS